MKSILFFLIALISANQLVFADAPFFDANELKKEKLFSSLEESMRSPEKVYRLNLSNTRLNEIPKEIEKFIHIQELSLSSNKIEFIPDEICKLKKLQKKSVSLQI